MAERQTAEGNSEDGSSSRRQRVSQAEVPSYTLNEALRVPYAIARNYAKQPTKPLDVAVALDLGPTSGQFRGLAGASLAYGLTEGGPNAEVISLTDRGLSIVAPTSDGEDIAAKLAAVLQPRVVGEFLRRYDGNPMPKRDIALNVLERELGTPSSVLNRAYDIIERNGRELGLFLEHQGKQYVRLDKIPSEGVEKASGQSEEGNGNIDTEVVEGQESDDSTEVNLADETVDPLDLQRNKRVFITHGRNRNIVGQLKELLTFGDLEPVVSVEHEAVAKPVPDKVLDEMRSCGAAIVHVGAEQRLMDSEGNEHRVLNQNVLIEIGAAMALYGRRFILLVEEGTDLPSNLQGLYEVRYQGEQLDYAATMKLLKSLNEFKKPS